MNWWKLAFLAMDLVDGQTLSQELQTDPIPFGRIVNVAYQIAIHRRLIRTKRKF